MILFCSNHEFPPVSCKIKARYLSFPLLSSHLHCYPSSPVPRPHPPPSCLFLPPSLSVQSYLFLNSSDLCISWSLLERPGRLISVVCFCVYWVRAGSMDERAEAGDSSGKAAPAVGGGGLKLAGRLWLVVSGRASQTFTCMRLTWGLC